MVTFDRTALALDRRSAHEAWDNTRTLMMRVSGYDSSLGAVRLDPVKIFNTTVDPLASTPGVKQSILTAREHAAAWGSIGNTLYFAILFAVGGFAAALKNTSGEINAIVASATSAKRALTDAEKAKIIAALRQLEEMLAGDRAKIEAPKPRLVAFIRTITEDRPGLISAAQKLDEAAAAVEKATNEQALKYLMDPGIMKMIIELGAKLSNEYRALGPAVRAIGDANELAQKSVQSLLAVWTTVALKFKSVIDVLASTQASVKTFEDLPLMLEIAEGSWNDLRDYLQQAA